MSDPDQDHGFDETDSDDGLLPVPRWAIGRLSVGELAMLCLGNLMRIEECQGQLAQKAYAETAMVFYDLLVRAIARLPHAGPGLSIGEDNVMSVAPNEAMQQRLMSMPIGNWPHSLECFAEELELFAHKPEMQEISRGDIAATLIQILGYRDVSNLDRIRPWFRPDYTAYQEDSPEAGRAVPAAMLAMGYFRLAEAAETPQEADFYFQAGTDHMGPVDICGFNAVRGAAAMKLDLPVPSAIDLEAYGKMTRPTLVKTFFDAMHDCTIAPRGPEMAAAMGRVRDIVAAMNWHAMAAEGIASALTETQFHRHRLSGRHVRGPVLAH